MSGNDGLPKQVVGSTDEHATNPFVAGYDVIDFLTTVAFVTANIANTTSLLLPMTSNIMHILNYAMLGYIQARGLASFGEQNHLGIQTEEEYDAALAALAPPKKGKKNNLDYAWDLAMYILKLKVCLFLVTVSVIGTVALTGAVAALVSTVLLPIGYAITTGINVLKFGKNFLQGLYDYFFKGHFSGDSEYQKNHDIVAKFHERQHTNANIPLTKESLDRYLNARNAINKAGRDNIQNGIFTVFSGAFFAASMLIILSSSMLVAATLPPVAMTIASALFIGAGLLFAVHGISVLRKSLRQRRGLEDSKTFFDWLTEKFYPVVTKETLLKEGIATEVKCNPVNDVEFTPFQGAAPVVEKKVVAEKKPVKVFTLYPYNSNGMRGTMFNPEQSQVRGSREETVDISMRGAL